MHLEVDIYFRWQALLAIHFESLAETINCLTVNCTRKNDNLFFFVVIITSKCKDIHWRNGVPARTHRSRTIGPSHLRRFSPRITENEMRRGTCTASNALSTRPHKNIIPASFAVSLSLASLEFNSISKAVNLILCTAKKYTQPGR